MWITVCVAPPLWSRPGLRLTRSQSDALEAVAACAHPCSRPCLCPCLWPNTSVSFGSRKVTGKQQKSAGLGAFSWHFRLRGFGLRKTVKRLVRATTRSDDCHPKQLVFHMFWWNAQPKFAQDSQELSSPAAWLKVDLHIWMIWFLLKVGFFLYHLPSNLFQKCGWLEWHVDHLLNRQLQLPALTHKTPQGLARSRQRLHSQPQWPSFDRSRPVIFKLTIGYHWIPRRHQRCQHSEAKHLRFQKRNKNAHIRKQWAFNMAAGSAKLLVLVGRTGQNHKIGGANQRLKPGGTMISCTMPPQWDRWSGTNSHLQESTAMHQHLPLLLVPGDEGVEHKTSTDHIQMNKV